MKREDLDPLPTDEVEVATSYLIEEEEPDDFDPGVAKDLRRVRPIIGGIRIRGARSADLERRQSFGTLGCFATTTGKDAGKHVLLTNYHVLDDPIGELHGPSCTGCTKGDGVGNPNTGDQIATVLRGKNNDQLDAAIAVLDSGVQFQREIIRDDLAAGSEAIRGTRVLTDAADRGLEVHKRGHRTLTTFGRVGRVGVQSPLIDGKIKVNQIQIDLPNKVELATSVTFQTNGTITVPAVDFIASGVVVNDLAWIQGLLNNGGPFRISQPPQQHEIVVAGSNFQAGTGSVGFFVTPPHFGLKGDSGSVVMDQNGMVVGLLWAATPDHRIGNAWATPIDVVERELRIKIDTAAAIGDVQIASLIEPDPQTDPAVLRPAALVGGVAAPPINLRERVEDDLKSVSRGREIYDLYFTHHLEVRELLDSNDKIARVWHRQGGPAIIQSVLDVVRTRETALPSTIRGKSWAERVKAILAVFAEFGSTRLRDDIKRFGDEVTGLAGFTYPQLLETLGK